MRRRTTLRALAGVGLAGLAGCLDDTGTGSGPTDTEPSERPTTDGGDPGSRTGTGTDWGTPRDGTPSECAEDVGPPPNSTAPGDYDCPSFRDASRTVCSHTSSGDEPLRLVPEADRFDNYPYSDDVQSLSITLHNDSDAEVGFNPYDWQLHVRDETDWRFLGPCAVPEPWITVAPGETFTWSLAETDHDTPDDVQQATMPMESAYPYAFTVTVLQGETEVELSALFAYYEAVPDLGR
jgi:hypothetical protein